MSSALKDDSNTFWVQGVFPGHTSRKIGSMITENGGAMARDYTDINLKRCIVSGAVWGAQGSTAASLTIKQIVKANLENLMEPSYEGEIVDPHENRIWFLPLEWLTDSIEAGEMQPEEDYDYELMVEAQREARRKQLAAERKQNGGVSKYGHGGRKAAEAQKKLAAEIKEFEREEAERKRNGLAPSGLDAPKMASISAPLQKPKPKPVITELPPSKKESHALAQSSLSFAADNHEPDPWDEMERRLKKKRPAPDVKPKPTRTTSNKPPASKPAAVAKASSVLSGSNKVAIPPKVVVGKLSSTGSGKLVGKALSRTSSLLGNKPNGTNALPNPAPRSAGKPDVKKRRPPPIDDDSDCVIISDSEEERPAYKKRA